MEASPASPARSSRLVRTYVLAAVSGLVLLYLVAFFASELPSVSQRTGSFMRRLGVLLFVTDAHQLIASWFGQPGEAGWGDRTAILALAVSIVLYGSLLGWWLMSLTGATAGLSRAERFLFGTAVGLNVLSLFTLLLGCLGGLRRELFLTAAVLTAAAALWRLSRGGGPAAGPWWPPAGGGDPWLSSRWLWLAAPALFFLVAGGVLPPVEFDVREYQLQAPKEFYQNGRIGFLPHNVYAQMPLGAHMHSLLAMVLLDDWWYGALAGKTVIALIGPLTALAIGLAGRRYFSTTVGMLAAILYLGTPWIARVSMTGLVDGVVGFYAFLSVFALLLACKAAGGPGQDPPAPHPPHWPATGQFALAGFLIGASVACKYPAALFVFLPLVAGVGLYLWTSRKEIRTPGQPLAVLLLAAAAGGGPWLVKNVVLTGNPTYPLLYDWFDGASRTDELNRRWQQAHQPRPYPGSGAAHAYSPRQAALYTAHVMLLSQWLSPALVPLAALSFFAVRGRQRAVVVALLAYLAWVLATWWLLTHRIDRFWVPILPVVALLAGVGSTWRPDRAWRIGVLALVSLSTLYGLLCMTSGVITSVDRRFFVALDVLRRDPLRVDAVHLYLNQHRGEVQKLLLVGDAQPFDLEVDGVLYNTTFDPSVFVQLLGDRNAAEFHQLLLSQRITHIYVHWGEIDRYRGPGNYGFARQVQPAVFDKLLFSGVLVALGDPDRQGRFWLYRVNPRVRGGESAEPLPSKGPPPPP